MTLLRDDLHYHCLLDNKQEIKNFDLPYNFSDKKQVYKLIMGTSFMIKFMLSTCYFFFYLFKIVLCVLLNEICRSKR